MHLANILPMTDIATSAADQPLKLTIHPLPQPAAGQAFLSGADNTPTFKDVLDIINPLQHIPIVSTIYQAMTGDVQSSGAKLAGGALFGGPLGFLSALADNILQSATGTDFSGNVLAAIEGKPVPALQQQPNTQTAGNNNPPDHLSANQRMAYNAYVNAGVLT